MLPSGGIFDVVPAVINVHTGNYYQIQAHEEIRSAKRNDQTGTYLINVFGFEAPNHDKEISHEGNAAKNPQEHSLNEVAHQVFTGTYLVGGWGAVGEWNLWRCQAAKLE